MPMHRTVAPSERGQLMRPLLLWLIGIPIPVIILLYVFHVL